jgi:transposase-like protein
MTGGVSKYSPTLLPIAQRAANMGMTEFELAELFGVTRRTLHNWRREHSEFEQACRLGKDGPNNRVVAAIFQRAVGYEYTVKKTRVNKAGDLIEWEETTHVPADVTAGIFWLKNRDNENWNDRNGSGESSFENYSDAELAKIVREKAAKLILHKATDKVLEGAVVEERPIKDVTPKK